MTTDKKSFTAGFFLACVNLSKDHGEDTLAFYLLQEGGFVEADAKAAGLEAEDLAEVRKIFASNT